MDADWDLHAVVRGCCSAVSSATTTTTTAASPPQNSSFYTQNCLTFIPDLCQQTTDNNSIEHLLNNLYHPLHFQNLHKPPSSPQSVPVSPLSVIGGLQDPPYHHQQQHEKRFMGKKQSLGISRSTTIHAQGTTKFKKRKNQIKRVCQVPAEGTCSDLWSWRKYGQKPIKGSPYPRGYYRCSTSKGCLARKQVERNRSDPNMLILTYTGEHTHPVPTHRNSLTGNCRNKTTISGDNATGHNPPPSSPESPEATFSPAEVKTEEIDTDDDDTNGDISGVVIDGDVLDDATGDIFSDHHMVSPVTGAGDH